MWSGNLTYEALRRCSGLLNSFASCLPSKGVANDRANDPLPAFHEEGRGFPRRTGNPSSPGIERVAVQPEATVRQPILMSFTLVMSPPGHCTVAVAARAEVMA